MSAQRTTWLLVLAIAAIAVVSYRSRVFKEPPAPPSQKIVVVTGGTGPYWQLIASGAKAAAKDHGFDVEVLMPDGDEDLVSQGKILAGISADKVDGIAVSPLDAEAQTRTIDRLSEQAFVVTVDSDAPLSSRLSYVGASNLAAGTKCAQLTQEALPEGGKVAVLMANLSKSNMIERKAGFEQTLLGTDSVDEPANNSYEIVDFLVDEGDNDRCEAQLRDVVENTPELACIVGLNARHGPILLRVLKDLNKLDQIKLVTFDDPKETLDGIEQGHIYATVAQDPYEYGYVATQLLASFGHREALQLPPPGLYSTLTINTTVVKPDNVADYRKTLERRLGGGSEPAATEAKATN